MKALVVALQDLRAAEIAYLQQHLRWDFILGPRRCQKIKIVRTWPRGCFEVYQDVVWLDIAMRYPEFVQSCKPSEELVAELLDLAVALLCNFGRDWLLCL